VKNHDPAWRDVAVVVFSFCESGERIKGEREFAPLAAAGEEE
jgi:hypothetical protein